MNPDEDDEDITFKVNYRSFLARKKDWGNDEIYK